MEKEECKISVWLCQEEKLVSGLTRRTTCSDVVQVLLDDHNQNHQTESGARAMLSGPPRSYCMVEKWRGFERILPNKTKILRLWTAWGEEQENVRFVLVRSEASLPNNGPRSAEARVVPSKESPCNLKGAARMAMTLTQEKQRRVVRKAFRKLAKINKKRQEALPKDSSSVERMETLVHLVLSQDHTIRQQIQRIKELDREIDRYEAKIHFDRMKRHGVNYVQDTYLEGASPEKGGSGREHDPDGGAEALAVLEEYAKKCQEVIELHERLSEQEQLQERMAAEIEEELNQRWMDRRKEELAAKETESCGSPLELGSSGDELLLEQERVKTQLSTSLYIGLRLNTDLEAVRGDLDYTQKVCEDKEAEMQTLLATLQALESPDTPEAGAGDGSSCGSPVPRSPPDSPGVWAETGGLCKECEANDEDSDTGLSSMHSQDSDSVSVPVSHSESLV
ncbi:ras association domain-containing protein 10 [Microcaecilia unicolor]|uniref:Ras association domain-containing protein 10 n=1 Tax=Microcaecilia unicolor TaxID=1415580 RepID=A0A6P7XY28_9AMPH|nr:ras association domain-containing protein 10 [Microcaecilia unicolor]